MLGFWISAVAMALMVGLLLARAVQQGQKGALLGSQAADLAVYRDQLAEVDHDQSRGVLAPAEAERMRLEVQRRMLDADRRGKTDGTARADGSGRLAFGLVFAGLVAGGLLYYYYLGAPGYPDLPLSTRLQAAEDAYRDRPTQAQAEAALPAFTPPVDIDPQLSTLIAQLRQAVASRPGDLPGHQLLAENEARLGNFAAAWVAQEAVVRLKGDTATAGDLAFLAHLMIGAAGGIVTPEAEQALIRALTLDPQDGWSRYYSGLMFAQIGRPDRSFALWEPLLREAPRDAPYLAPIRGMIQDVADAAGVAYAPTTDGGPLAADVAAAADMSEGDRAEMIRGMVAGLEERLNTQGGPVEDWAKLITSLGVLGEGARAQAAYGAAQAAFSGKPGELAALKAAADQAGVAE